MPDPHRELDDIIPPPPPAAEEPADHRIPLWAMLLAGPVVGLGLWRWYRLAPLRQLARLEWLGRSATPDWSGLGRELALLVARRHGLARLDARRCPPGQDGDAWSDWIRDLDHLRFTPPAPEHADRFAHLCQQAADLLRR